jgi:hypothetical protein
MCRVSLLKASGRTIAKNLEYAVPMNESQAARLEVGRMNQTQLMTKQVRFRNVKHSGQTHIPIAVGKQLVDPWSSQGRHFQMLMLIVRK